MKALRIQNLRSLEDTGYIDLKPITVFIGKNSCGKSTLLRTFPMFKQSVSRNNRGLISLYGDLVDFGEYKDAVSAFGDNKSISFGFKLNYNDIENVRHIRNRRRSKKGRSFSDNPEIKFEFSTKEKNSQKISQLESFQVSYLENVILGEVDSYNKVRLKINNKSYEYELHCDYQNNSNLMPHLYFKSENARSKSINYHQLECPPYKDIISKLRLLLNSSFESDEMFSELYLNEILESGLIGIDNKFRDKDNLNLVISEIKSKVLKQKEQEFARDIEEMIYSNVFFTKKDLLKDLMKLDSETILTENCEDFIEIYNILTIATLPTIFNSINDHISATSEQLSYSGPVRATAQRFYRLRDLAVNEVDMHGTNLPNFINSLSDADAKSYREWTNRLFKFEVSVKNSGGHTSLILTEEDVDGNINIADKGFGFSQILPIITQLWAISNKKYRYRNGIRGSNQVIYCIEQPELHLHPEYQALLADAFVKVAMDVKETKNIDISLIIETHSKTMVNRLGHNIAYEKCPNDAINVVIFNKKSHHEPTEVSFAKFSEEGYLENWPYGFFDPNVEL